MQQNWWKECPSLTEDAIRTFATVIRDFNPIHHDNDAARADGLLGIIAPGVMIIGMASAAIAEEIPGAKVVKLEMKFRKPLYAGSLPTVFCNVRFNSEGLRTSQIEISVKNGNEKIATGECLVILARKTISQKAA